MAFDWVLRWDTWLYQTNFRLFVCAKSVSRLPTYFLTCCLRKLFTLCSVWETCNNLLKNLCPYAWILRSLSALRIQFLHLYRSTEVSRFMKILNFVRKLTTLRFYILFNLVIGAESKLSFAIIFLRSKWLLGAWRWPLHQVSPFSIMLVAVFLLLLLTTIYLFSRLISIPYTPNTFPSLVVSSYNSSLPLHQQNTNRKQVVHLWRQKGAKLGQMPF